MRIEPSTVPPEPTAGQANALTDASLAARMRLALALAVLLAVQFEPWGWPGMDPSRWPLFVAYGMYSLAIDVAAQSAQRWAAQRALHWLDLLWYGLMVMLTGGVGSLFFLFFFVAIVTASFRWGRREGSRVTLAAGAMFMLGAALAPEPAEPVRLLLRTGFLLGLGHLCVHWGEAQIQLTRRLALLRDVSRLSNPRFGAEHTLQHVLSCTRDFYGASACLLVLQDPASGLGTWRQLRHSGPQHAEVQALNPVMAAALLPFEPDAIVLHRGTATGWMRGHATETLAARHSPWQAASGAHAHQAIKLAALMEAASLVSVPVALRQGQGRLCVCRESPSFDRDDALFLGQLVAQAFPMIDHIDLLDRMGTEAAARARQKFALDLHDSAVQPYIGLQLGLAALRHQAGEHNPLRPALEKLETMAGQVAQDLRRYAQQVRQPQGQERAFVAELRQQAAQVRDFYGVDIAMQIEGDLPLNDRLLAEVLQVVREGLTNICKHTLAQRGEVALRCHSGWLGIRIANDANAGAQTLNFMPRSISERACALGGRTHVQQEPDGRTAVHIHIPV